MDKWLAKFLDNTLENRTDKTDILPRLVSVSGMSVPFPESLEKISPSRPGSPIDQAPTPPLHPGWLVVYRDQRGALCGGCDDRQHGTVAECRWSAGAWTVTLTDGQTIPLSRVRSVGAVDHKGRLYGAWEVNTHGYDGEGPVTRGGQN